MSIGINLDDEEALPEQGIGINLREACDGLAEDMGCPGWTYRDLPRLKEEFMDRFIDIAGEENLKWLTYATYRNANGVWKRGQVLISPDGMARIEEYNSAVQGEEKAR